LDFAGAALRAMRAAAAPHYPAEPRALVGADILPLLATTSGTELTGEVVRTVFATCDATQFSERNGNGARLEVLLPLQTGIEKVLMELESRLEVEA
jgi:hypothetical protein